MSTYYTQEHEWIEVEGEVGTIGITDYAQSQLGDITYADLPTVGASFKAQDSLVVVDSVKAAADVYAPVSGTVAEVNGELEAAPELINEQPEEGGWLVRIKLADASELGGLMDRAAYDAFVKGL